MQWMAFWSENDYLLMDRDASFSAEFRDVLKRARVKPVRIPPKAPNCNPHTERFISSLKRECLDRMILFGPESLHRATREYLEHYGSKLSLRQIVAP
jgi:hypothetical protein